MLLLLRSTGLGLDGEIKQSAGSYDDKKRKVIVNGKRYRLTQYELDQLLELEHSKDAQDAAEAATAIAIAFAKAKPAKAIAKPLPPAIAVYDDESDIEELLMML